MKVDRRAAGTAQKRREQPVFNVRARRVHRHYSLFSIRYSFGKVSRVFLAELLHEINQVVHTLGRHGVIDGSTHAAN